MSLGEILIIALVVLVVIFGYSAIIVGARADDETYKNRADAETREDRDDV